MENSIRFLFELSVADNQLPAVKDLLSSAIEDVQAKDFGVLDYEFYFDDGSTKFYAVERFKDSDAVMKHLGIVGETLNKLLEVAPITRAEIFGTPSAELLTALEPFNPRVFARWGGLTR